jgi:hypothetical protein
VVTTVDEATGEAMVQPKCGVHAFRFLRPLVHQCERIVVAGNCRPIRRRSCSGTARSYGHLFSDRGDRNELAEATRMLLGDQAAAL